MKFPSIELKDLENKSFILDDLLKEKKLNLLLFYNTNCLGCTGRAIPLAYELMKKYDFLNVVILHSSFRISPFTSEEVLSVFTDGKSPFPIYREEKHELYDFFECEGTPHWIILDENKTQIHSFFGSQDRSQLKLEYALLEYQEKTAAE